jgi:hypothetical protein
MKKLAGLFILLSFAAITCRKPEPLKVSFNVLENSAASPTYSITYTSDQTGASSVSSSSGSNWSSPVTELERGQFVTMKVECSAPQFDITAQIFVNGFIWKTDRFSNPVSSLTVTGTLE